MLTSAEKINSETAIDRTVRKVRRLLRIKFLKTSAVYFIADASLRCRGYPCPRMCETHGGFHVQISSYSSRMRRLSGRSSLPPLNPSQHPLIQPINRIHIPLCTPLMRNHHNRLRE